METSATIGRRYRRFPFRVDHLLRLYSAARRAFARTALLPAKARLQGPEGERKRKGPRATEETGGPFPPQIQAGGVAGQAESGRGHSRGFLCALGRSQLFVAARVCPPDRHALSRLAPRPHRRWATAKHRRSDQ